MQHYVSPAGAAGAFKDIAFVEEAPLYCGLLLGSSHRAPAGRCWWVLQWAGFLSWISQLDFSTLFLNCISQLCLDHVGFCSIPTHFLGGCSGCAPAGQDRVGGWVGGGGLLAATSGIAATGRESVPSESVRLLQPGLQYWAVSTQNNLHTKA